MKRYFLIGALITVLMLKIGIQDHIDVQKAREGLSTRYLFQPGEMINSVLAAGFRGLAADLIWIRVDDYSHRGQWYKLLPLFKMVTFLQPKFITAWQVGGWHMAYNLYFHASNPEEKSKWLGAAFQFLKAGIQHNPDRYELYFEVGWTYFHKVKDYPNAIKYLTKAVQYKHPQVIEHVLAHAYEANGELGKALDIWRKLQDDPNHEEALQHVVNKYVKELGEKNHQ